MTDEVKSSPDVLSFLNVPEEVAQTVKFLGATGNERDFLLAVNSEAKSGLQQATCISAMDKLRESASPGSPSSPEAKGKIMGLLEAYQVVHDLTTSPAYQGGNLPLKELIGEYAKKQIDFRTKLATEAFQESSE